MLWQSTYVAIRTEILLTRFKYSRCWNNGSDYSYPPLVISHYLPTVRACACVCVCVCVRVRVVEYDTGQFNIRTHAWERKKIQITVTRVKKATYYSDLILWWCRKVLLQSPSSQDEDCLALRHVSRKNNNIA